LSRGRALTFTRSYSPRTRSRGRSRGGSNNNDVTAAETETTGAIATELVSESSTEPLRHHAVQNWVDGRAQEVKHAWKTETQTKVCRESKDRKLITNSGYVGVIIIIKDGISLPEMQKRVISSKVQRIDRITTNAWVVLIL